MNIVIRSGSSFARSPDMLHFLTENENTRLYELWRESWPIDILSGGVLQITCQHVLDVGEKELTKLFGKRFAAKLLEIAARENV